MQIRSRRAFREARIGPMNHHPILSNPQEQVQKLHKHQKNHSVSISHTDIWIKAGSTCVLNLMQWAAPRQGCAHPKHGQSKGIGRPATQHANPEWVVASQ